jgi:hypothetical protein
MIIRVFEIMYFPWNYKVLKNGRYLAEFSKLAGGPKSQKNEKEHKTPSETKCSCGFCSNPAQPGQYAKGACMQKAHVILCW